MITQLQSMWDRILASNMKVQRQIELNKMDSRNIYSAAYCADPQSREFENQ